MIKVACYCRVSREDLNNENQAKIISEYCQKQGWDALHWFREEQSTRKTRPIKGDLMQRLRNSEFDVLIFVRIDRFARSTTELVIDIEELVNKGVRVISIQNGFDFDRKGYNSTNMLMLRIFSAFAEFERELIRERTLEGLARAKAQGKKLGRPRKTPRVNPETVLEENIAKLKNARFPNTDSVMQNHRKEWEYLREKVLVKGGYTCTHCKRQFKEGMEIDHIIPIYKGGLVFDESNIQILCNSCHLEKSKRDRQSD